MSKFTIVRELFEMYRVKRKFHMIPLIAILLALIGVTVLSQTGLIAFIYPI